MPLQIDDQMQCKVAAAGSASTYYRNVFVDGGQYVFDGNRVVARFHVSRNEIGRWRLRTVDPNLTLVVTPDLRVRVYKRVGNKVVVRLVRAFDTVFDAGVMRLTDAIRICAEHRHVWSPEQVGEFCRWKWCLVCGEECECDGDSEKVLRKAPRILPRLHGPVLGKGLDGDSIIGSNDFKRTASSNSRRLS